MAKFIQDAYLLMTMDDVPAKYQTKEIKVFGIIKSIVANKNK